MSNESKLIRETSVSNPTYPSNTTFKRETREKFEPIVKGKVIKQKKGWIAKIKESMQCEDRQSISDYIIYDIIIPTIKSAISDTIRGSLDMWLFKERYRPNNIKRDGTKSYVSYNHYYNGNENQPNRNSQNHLNNYSFEEVIFNSRGEAEDVLSKLSEAIEEYGLVSVGDFYDLCGIHSSYTDNKYGWSNLREAFTERNRDGYIIKLPRPKPIN